MSIDIIPVFAHERAHYELTFWHEVLIMEACTCMFMCMHVNVQMQECECTGVQFTFTFEGSMVP